MNKYVQITKSILGEDIFEHLEKMEMFKPDTNSTLDPNEIKVALQIVPRAVLGFLIANLKGLNVGGNVDLPLPFADAILHVNKISQDVYTGDVVQSGKRITEFQYRSLPGIGLILMSTFELYDVSDLDNLRDDKQESNIDKIQDIIDERLKLNALVRSVVDQRISERDAIQQLINERLSEECEYEDEDEDEEYEDEPLHSDEEDSVEILDDSEEDVMDSSTKKSKLKEFLDSREKKRQEKVELDKSEIDCPNCKSNLYKGEGDFKLCICYGQYYNKEIKIKKSEDGRFSFNFPKSFDTDNVEMLLEAIKSNK